ncbi:unnamed protein product [marine sediment metagenome]|uniref:Uncharacterized protein n=1 Tax=marine sediment metagenome TaxID=412755 RepID=X0X147_9ZZZZ
MPLFQLSDVQAVRDVSQIYDTARFNTFAQSAQDEQLRVWLGDALYLDLVTSPSDAKYVTLLDGETYTKNGKVIKFYGLKKYLSFVWLSINAIEGDDFQAEIGTINFNQPNTSFPKSKSVTSKKYIADSIVYKNNAIDYLNEKKSTYTLWEGGASDNKTKFSIIEM